MMKNLIYLLLYYCFFLSGKIGNNNNSGRFPINY